MWKSVLKGAVIAVMAVAPALVTAGPAHAAQVYSEVLVRHTGKCLDVTSASAANGALIQQWTCLGAAQRNQHWALVRVGTTQDYELVVAHTGKCLDVVSASSARGADVQQWSCLGSPQRNQLVRLRSVPNTTVWFQLVFRHSNQCLDVRNASPNQGANLQQWDCLSAQLNQQFRFVPIN